ncbi:hypothetical protein VSPL_10030 [Vibrio splendidus]|nr:hypothetical protein VSPL_10030 [Vibrio splendidus]
MVVYGFDITNCQLKHFRLFYSSHTTEYELYCRIAISFINLNLNSDS